MTFLTWLACAQFSNWCNWYSCPIAEPPAVTNHDSWSQGMNKGMMMLLDWDARTTVQKCMTSTNKTNTGLHYYHRQRLLIKRFGWTIKMISQKASYRCKAGNIPQWKSSQCDDNLSHDVKQCTALATETVVFTVIASIKSSKQGRGLAGGHNIHCST